MAVCPRCQKEVSEAYQYCPFCNSEMHPAEWKPDAAPKQAEPDTPLGRLFTSSGNSSAMKVVLGIIGWLTIVLGAIGSYGLARTFTEKYSDFNAVLFLSGLFGSIASGCLFLGIRRVLVNQEEIQDTLRKVLYKK